jgi:hypothetical protein
MLRLSPLALTSTMSHVADNFIFSSSLYPGRGGVFVSAPRLGTGFGLFCTFQQFTVSPDTVSVFMPIAAGVGDPLTRWYFLQWYLDQQGVRFGPPL